MALARKSSAYPPIERLKQVLEYNAETGVFTWLVATGKCNTPGKVAGSKTSNGYTRIRVDNSEYLAHRLAWMYVNGAPPDGYVDHIDGDKKNNRISNLRIVTHRVNAQNLKRAMSHNRTGLLGVSPHGKSVFRAVINIDGVSTYLGSFKTANLAHEVYLSAKRKYHAGCTI